MGIDNDEQAIVASRDNAERNGVSEKLDLYTPDRFEPFESCVLVANILAESAGRTGAAVRALVKCGGLFAISGILEGQHHELLRRYAEWFDKLETTLQDGWVRISGRRR